MGAVLQPADGEDVLTQGTELGSTETGARALGEVFQEQLGGIVQADCEALAAIINNGLIVPLVRYNFGEQDTIRCSRRRSA
jgi:phage gp29-like protein